MYTLFVKKRNTFYLYRKQTAKNMQVITAKDLRADQKKYFDLEENEIIFVVRREACPIKISVATEEENLINTDSCAWYFSLWDMCFAFAKCHTFVYPFCISKCMASKAKKLCRIISVLTYREVLF